MAAPAVSEDDAQLWTLAGTFALLSCLAVGGINTLFPEMHRQTVEVHGWMTSERFTDLFAIAQAAPGPNLIIVTLIGWDVAGFAGAMVATIATVGPTSLLAYCVGAVWDRFRTAPWRIAIQAGLTPLTIGLIAATAYVLMRAADKTPVAFLVTFGAAALMHFTGIHPLLLLGAGAAIGMLGLI